MQSGTLSRHVVVYKVFNLYNTEQLCPVLFDVNLLSLIGARYYKTDEKRNEYDAERSGLKIKWYIFSFIIECQHDIVALKWSIVSYRSNS